jgi:hypothetical protein
MTGRHGVVFTLHGSKTARMQPAFKIKGWVGAAPDSIALGGKQLAAAKEFNAAVVKDALLLQILEPIRQDATISIPER